jgi:multidrug transporter EmrE-like cation transporter
MSKHETYPMLGYLFIAMTVLLTVYGQLILKWQVTLAGPLPAGATPKLAFLGHLLLNPWVLSGLGAAFAASLCWMMALTKLPLSTAYPFTAAAFVMVIFGGAWLFSEPVSVVKMLGVGLITVGVVLAGAK